MTKQKEHGMTKQNEQRKGVKIAKVMWITYIIETTSVQFQKFASKYFEKLIFDILKQIAV